MDFSVVFSHTIYQVVTRLHVPSRDASQKAKISLHRPPMLINVEIHPPPIIHFHRCSAKAGYQTWCIHQHQKTLLASDLQKPVSFVVHAYGDYEFLSSFQAIFWGFLLGSLSPLGNFKSISFSFNTSFYPIQTQLLHIAAF